MSWPPVCIQAERRGFHGKYFSFILKLYLVFPSLKQDIPVAYYCDCSYSVPLWAWPITLLIIYLLVKMNGMDGMYS